MMLILVKSNFENILKSKDLHIYIEGKHDAPLSRLHLQLTKLYKEGESVSPSHFFSLTKVWSQRDPISPSSQEV